MLAVSSVLSNTVFAGTAKSKILYAGTFDGEVFASIDGGASWQNAGLTASNSVNALAVDPLDSQTLFAGTQESGAFKRLTVCTPLLGDE